jgi:hypothetical protein
MITDEKEKATMATFKGVGADIFRDAFAMDALYSAHG